MGKEKLNILPVLTYSWLGVNDTQRELDDNTAGVTALDADSITLDVTGSASYEINAAQGKEAFAVMFVKPQRNARLSVQINAQDSAKVKLVQVFEGSAQTVSGVKASLADSAQFELIQLYLGTHDAVSETDVKLDGRKSAFKAGLGYLLGGNDKLDINLLADHTGRKTNSEITVKGVMNDSAEKVFKGTIDFKNGSSGAVGAENEDVLLIGEKAVNKTVPLILCAEEDVEGSHGASIGRVDEEHIFYMQSRGIPEDKITELAAQSKISQIVNMIGDEAAAQRINTILGRGKEDE